MDQLVQYGTQLLLSDARRAASVHSDPREALRSAGVAPAFQYLEDYPGFIGCGFRRHGRVRMVGLRR